MKGYMESTVVTLKDLGDQAPGPYVAFTPIGVLYTLDTGTWDDGLRRVRLPNGDAACLPDEGVSIIPVSILEFTPGAEYVRSKHQDQHDLAAIREEMHEDDDDDDDPTNADSDLTGRALSGGIAL